MVVLLGLHALYVAGGNHALPQQSLYQTKKEPGEEYVRWFIGLSSFQLEQFVSSVSWGLVHKVGGSLLWVGYCGILVGY